MDANIDKLLSKTLAHLAERSQVNIQRNNSCLQSLRDTILLADRQNLQFLRTCLIAFTQTEAERDFRNIMVDLYLTLINQQLKNKPVS